MASVAYQNNAGGKRFLWSAAACRRFAPAYPIIPKAGPSFPHSKFGALILPFSAKTPPATCADGGV
jgi:hypothetical protein